MITFIVDLRVRPGQGAAFEAIASHVRDLSRANEPGVLYYDFARSVDETDAYVVVEVYRDAAAHAAHLRQPWVIESLPRSRALVEGSFAIRRYERPQG